MKETDKYYRMFTDMWRFFRKYYGGSGEAWCQAAFKEATELSGRYGESPFISHMLSSILEELERENAG